MYDIVTGKGHQQKLTRIVNFCYKMGCVKTIPELILYISDYKTPIKYTNFLTLIFLVCSSTSGILKP